MPTEPPKSQWDVLPSFDRETALGLIYSVAAFAWFVGFGVFQSWDAGLANIVLWTVLIVSLTSYALRVATAQQRSILTLQRDALYRNGAFFCRVDDAEIRFSTPNKGALERKTDGKMLMLSEADALALREVLRPQIDPRTDRGSVTPSYAPPANPRNPATPMNPSHHQVPFAPPSDPLYNHAIEALSRTEDDARVWFARLSGLREADYRSTPIDESTLWRILEDPNAPSDARAGAAIVLRLREAPDARNRLQRIALEPSQKRLAKVVHRIADEEDESELESIVKKHVG